MDGPCIAVFRQPKGASDGSNDPRPDVHPRLYGWPWCCAVAADVGVSGMTAPFWIGERLARLQRDYPTGDLQALACEYDVSVQAIRRAAERNGIKRDREMVRRGCSERGTTQLAAWRATVKAQPKPVRFERHPLEEVMTSWMR